jgi:hypothetical protein
MLHVRDCPGTTITMDVCPFPWCRKVKHLMYHLVTCSKPDSCAICSPIALSANMKGIIGLSNHRRNLLKAENPSAVTGVTTVKPYPVTNKSSQEVKPLIQSENRPIQKKLPCPVTTIKPSTVKSSIVPSVKSNIPNRPATNPSPKSSSATKPTNGVVVKSLVKPAGRSVVILKSRAQRPGFPGSKPTVAALCGSKSSLTTAGHENGDTSSSRVVSDESTDTCPHPVNGLKQNVCEGLDADIAIDELEVAIVEDLIMTGDTHETLERCYTEDVESNSLSQLDKETSPDGNIVMKSEQSSRLDMITTITTDCQAPNDEQRRNDLSLINVTTTVTTATTAAIVSSDVSTATIKSDDQITSTMINMNANSFFPQDLGSLEHGKLMEAIIQESVGTSPVITANAPQNSLCNECPLKQQDGESSGFLLLDSSFNITSHPGNTSTLSFSALAELHDDDLKMQQLSSSSYDYTDQITTSPKTSSSPILFPEIQIKVKKEKDGEF